MKPSHGSSLAFPYSLAMGLMVAASFGWPFVLVFVLVAGPGLGFSFARRSVSGPKSAPYPALNTASSNVRDEAGVA